MDFNYLEVDLLKISKEASKHKKEDPNVINATLGVFLDDSNNLYNFPSVNKTINQIDKTLLKSYLAIDGGKEYINNIYKYIFQQKEFNTHYKSAFWTSGGSGAIYLGLLNYRGKNVLLPNLRWGEYDNFCKVLNKTIINYNLIKNNAFDLNSLKTILKNYQNKELLIIINDPSHNPSGYSMNKTEYIKLIKLVNTYKNIEIKLLIDIAYLDFSNNNYRKEIIPLFKQLKDHTDLYFAFSGSKSFGVYGFRMGALIQLTKQIQTHDSFKRFMISNIEAIYGLPNSLSILFLNEIMKTKTIYKEQLEAKRILKERSMILLNELNKNNIDYFPYHSGFFLTIKEDKPLQVTNQLKKENVYVVPTYKGLRIALSAINEKEIKQLVKILKETKNMEDDKNE